MTDGEKKAIDDLFSLTHINGYINLYDQEKANIYTSNLKRWQNGVKVLLNLMQTQQEEIEKKDNIVRSIISRLNNDIKNIAETKAKKSEHYLDDYTRCRLKAYKTKTKEIKEYIEKEYFINKVEKEN